jgi:hypothetical protein
MDQVLACVPCTTNRRVSEAKPFSGKQNRHQNKKHEYWDVPLFHLVSNSMKNEPERKVPLVATEP